MFGDFVGELDLADGAGTTFQTTNNLFAFANLFDFFAVEYRVWVPATVEDSPPPGSAMADVADAMGSTNNSTVMLNLETNLNVGSCAMNRYIC
jgi:hypothetical protein